MLPILAALLLLVRAQQLTADYYLNASVTSISLLERPCIDPQWRFYQHIYFQYTWIAGGPVVWEIGGQYDSCPVTSVTHSGVISQAQPIAYFNWTIFAVSSLACSNLPPDLCIRFRGDGTSDTVFHINSPISIPPSPPPSTTSTATTATASSTATLAGTSGSTATSTAPSANRASKYTVFYFCVALLLAMQQHRRTRYDVA